MESDASGSGQWRFAQCFGDKGEVEDITEGLLASLSPIQGHILHLLNATNMSSQPISSQPWNSITLVITLRQAIKVDGSYYLNGTMRCVIQTVSSHCRVSYRTDSRKRVASTSFTPSFSRMNQNSTT